MSCEKSDLSLPSYEDSLLERPSASPHGGQHIIDQLTNVRSRHVRETIDALVYPRIEEQAIYGIANTTIALIPSDAVPEQQVSDFDFGDAGGEKPLQLMGFPSDDVVQQVRLKGPLNRTQFWRQPGVLEELQRTLQARLATAPFAPTLPPNQPTSPASAPPAAAPAAEGRRLLRKKQEPSRRTSSGHGVERAAEATAVKPASGLHADVVLEHVCFRTVSDFGLYETVDLPAVVVRVIVGL